MLLHLLVALIVGGTVGWLAGIIMKSNGSTLRNVVCGLLGGVVGGWLSSLVGAGNGWLMSFIFSIIGACIVLYVGKKLFK